MSKLEFHYNLGTSLQGTIYKSVITINTNKSLRKNGRGVVTVYHLTGMQWSTQSLSETISIQS